MIFEFVIKTLFILGPPVFLVIRELYLEYQYQKNKP